MPPLFTQSKANRRRIFWKRGGGNDQIHGRKWLFASEETQGIIEQINPRAALGYVVGPDEFLKIHPNAWACVRHGQANESCVFLKAAPVSFIGECFALLDAQRGEQSPPVDNAGLPGRKAGFLDR